MSYYHGLISSWSCILCFVCLCCSLVQFGLGLGWLRFEPFEVVALQLPKKLGPGRNNNNNNNRCTFLTQRVVLLVVAAAVAVAVVYLPSVWREWLQPTSQPGTYSLPRSPLRSRGSGASRTTVFVMLPIPSTWQVTTSPSFSHSGGLRKQPTPGGVPVNMRSPGCSVQNVEIHAMHAFVSKMNSCTQQRRTT